MQIHVISSLQAVKCVPEYQADASIHSPRRLPDWMFGILLWLIFIGAPFSFFAGFAWGCLSTLPSPLAPYHQGPSHGVFELFELVVYGLAGILVGVPILAIVATSV